MDPQAPEREVLSTEWFRLIEKVVEGSAHPYYVLEAPDCVTVLALSSDGRIPLVRQYRPALDRDSLELPSGHIDPGDASPEAAARRELLEETGYRAEQIQLLGVIDPDVGRLRVRIYCYFARNAVKVAPSNNDDEQIEVSDCTPGELRGLIRSGRMCHAQDLAVVLLAQLQGVL